MTASTRIDIDLTAPIVDYEPPPVAADNMVRTIDRLRVVSDPVTESAIGQQLDVPPPSAALAMMRSRTRRDSPARATAMRWLRGGNAKVAVNASRSTRMAQISRSIVRKAGSQA